jgi:hypothetical protein
MQSTGTNQSIGGRSARPPHLPAVYSLNQALAKAKECPLLRRTDVSWRLEWEDEIRQTLRARTTNVITPDAIVMHAPEKSEEGRTFLRERYVSSELQNAIDAYVTSIKIIARIRALPSDEEKANIFCRKLAESVEAFLATGLSPESPALYQQIRTYGGTPTQWLQLCREVFQTDVARYESIFCWSISQTRPVRSCPMHCGPVLQALAPEQLDRPYQLFLAEYRKSGLAQEAMDCASKACFGVENDEGGVARALFTWAADVHPLYWAGEDAPSPFHPETVEPTTGKKRWDPIINLSPDAVLYYLARTCVSKQGRCSPPVAVNASYLLTAIERQFRVCLHGLSESELVRFVSGINVQWKLSITQERPAKGGKGPTAKVIDPIYIDSDPGLRERMDRYLLQVFPVQASRSKQICTTGVTIPVEASRIDSMVSVRDYPTAPELPRASFPPRAQPVTVKKPKADMIYNDTDSDDDSDEDEDTSVSGESNSDSDDSSVTNRSSDVPLTTTPGQSLTQGTSEESVRPLLGQLSLGATTKDVRIQQSAHGANPQGRSVRRRREDGSTGAPNVDTEYLRKVFENPDRCTLAELRGYIHGHDEQLSEEQPKIQDAIPEWDTLNKKDLVKKLEELLHLPEEEAEFEEFEDTDLTDPLDGTPLTDAYVVKETGQSYNGRSLRSLRVFRDPNTNIEIKETPVPNWRIRDAVNQYLKHYRVDPKSLDAPEATTLLFPRGRPDFEGRQRRDTAESRANATMSRIDSMLQNGQINQREAVIWRRDAQDILDRVAQEEADEQRQLNAEATQATGGATEEEESVRLVHAVEHFQESLWLGGENEYQVLAVGPACSIKSLWQGTNSSTFDIKVIIRDDSPLKTGTILLTRQAERVPCTLLQERLSSDLKKHLEARGIPASGPVAVWQMYGDKVYLDIAGRVGHSFRDAKDGINDALTDIITNVDTYMDLIHGAPRVGNTGETPEQTQPGAPTLPDTLMSNERTQEQTSVSTGAMSPTRIRQSVQSLRNSLWQDPVYNLSLGPTCTFKFFEPGVNVGTDMYTTTIVIRDSNPRKSSAVILPGGTQVVPCTPIQRELFTQCNEMLVTDGATVQWSTSQDELVAHAEGEDEDLLYHTIQDLLGLISQDAHNYSDLISAGLQTGNTGVAETSVPMQSNSVDVSATTHGSVRRVQQFAHGANPQGRSVRRRREDDSPTAPNVDTEYLRKVIENPDRCTLAELRGYIHGHDEQLSEEQPKIQDAIPEWDTLNKKDLVKKLEELLHLPDEEAEFEEFEDTDLTDPLDGTPLTDAYVVKETGQTYNGRSLRSLRVFRDPNTNIEIKETPVPNWRIRDAVNQYLKHYSIDPKSLDAPEATTLLFPRGRPDFEGRQRRDTAESRANATMSRIDSMLQNGQINQREAVIWRRDAQEILDRVAQEEAYEQRQLNAEATRVATEEEERDRFYYAVDRFKESLWLGGENEYHVLAIGPACIVRIKWLGTRSTMFSIQVEIGDDSPLKTGTILLTRQAQPVPCTLLQERLSSDFKKHLAARGIPATSPVAVWQMYGDKVCLAMVGSVERSFRDAKEGINRTLTDIMVHAYAYMDLIRGGPGVGNIGETPEQTQPVASTPADTLMSNEPVAAGAVSPTRIRQSVQSLRNSLWQDPVYNLSLGPTCTFKFFEPGVNVDTGTYTTTIVIRDSNPRKLSAIIFSGGTQVVPCTALQRKLFTQCNEMLVTDGATVQWSTSQDELVAHAEGEDEDLLYRTIQDLLGLISQDAHNYSHLISAGLQTGNTGAVNATVNATVQDTAATEQPTTPTTVDAPMSDGGENAIDVSPTAIANRVQNVLNLLWDDEVEDRVLDLSSTCRVHIEQIVDPDEGIYDITLDIQDDSTHKTSSIVLPGSDLTVYYTPLQVKLFEEVDSKMGEPDNSLRVEWRSSGGTLQLFVGGEIDDSLREVRLSIDDTLRSIISHADRISELIREDAASSRVAETSVPMQSNSADVTATAHGSVRRVQQSTHGANPQGRSVRRRREDDSQATPDVDTEYLRKVFENPDRCTLAELRGYIHGYDEHLPAGQPKIQDAIPGWDTLNKKDLVTKLEELLHLPEEEAEFEEFEDTDLTDPLDGTPLTDAYVVKETGQSYNGRSLRSLRVFRDPNTNIEIEETPVPNWRIRDAVNQYLKHFHIDPKSLDAPEATTLLFPGGRPDFEERQRRDTAESRANATMSQIDSMLQNGQIDANQATRWRGETQEILDSVALEEANERNRVAGGTTQGTGTLTAEQEDGVESLRLSNAVERFAESLWHGEEGIFRVLALGPTCSVKINHLIRSTDPDGLVSISDQRFTITIEIHDTNPGRSGMILLPGARFGVHCTIVQEQLYHDMTYFLGDIPLTVHSPQVVWRTPDPDTFTATVQGRVGQSLDIVKEAIDNSLTKIINNIDTYRDLIRPDSFDVQTTEDPIDVSPTSIRQSVQRVTDSPWDALRLSRSVERFAESLWEGEQGGFRVLALGPGCTVKINYRGSDTSPDGLVSLRSYEPFTITIEIRDDSPLETGMILLTGEHQYKPCTLLQERLWDDMHNYLGDTHPIGYGTRAVWTMPDPKTVVATIEGSTASLEAVIDGIDDALSQIIDSITVYSGLISGVS